MPANNPRLLYQHLNAYHVLPQGEEELDQNEKKKLKKLKAMEESDDEEEGEKSCGANLSGTSSASAKFLDGCIRSIDDAIAVFVRILHVFLLYLWFLRVFVCIFCFIGDRSERWPFRSLVGKQML